MRPLGKPMIGLEAEMKLIVSLEMTIGHLIAGMPYVYATPMMVLHMEMAAASAIESSLPPGFTSVGMEVNVRHLDRKRGSGDRSRHLYRCKERLLRRRSLEQRVQDRGRYPSSRYRQHPRLRETLRGQGRGAAMTRHGIW
jgi:hypothetical protein